MESPIIGSEIKSGGIDNKQRFGFNLDAHSFELLSKNLYSNPILAVCREYTTNAIDALKVAKTEHKGYIVHLPNPFELFWSIRDFGTGVSADAMTSLFCFNHSDKRHTNTLNGTFGLGSKSFLAISDSATFTSYYNGTKHVYFVYKENGIPTYTKAEESQTDEENGLEVRIPIEYSQRHNIIDTYKRFCRHVEIKPTIIGYDQIQWDAELKTYSDSCIHLGDDCMFDLVESRNAKLTVVFGSVAYPVNQTIAGLSYRHNAVVNIPTGVVDIVPSREELRMTQKTMDYLDTLSPRLQAQVQKRIDEVYKNEGFIAACKYVNTIFIGNPPKINGKDQFLKLKIAQTAKFDYNSKFKFVIPQSETIIDIHNKVILNFDGTQTRLKTRLRYFLEFGGNIRNTVVVISDVEEAKKYCEHFEVDIAELPHLKDITPPKETKNGHIKNDRFTGIRIVERNSNTLICKDIDMSGINTMFFVYRNGTKLFADSEYSRDISNIQEIIACEPWNKEIIYTLTARQHKDCMEYGIDLVNLMDDVHEKYNPSEFDEEIRKDILLNKDVTRGIPVEIRANILPPQFRSLISAGISNKTKYDRKNLYKKLGYGKDIITKHESAMKSFVNSNVGILAGAISNYSNKPPKEVILKLMTIVMNTPELMNSENNS